MTKLDKPSIRLGTLLAPLACAAWLARPCEAQAAPYTLDLTAPPAGQYYTRTASGDFDADGRWDVAYLLGSTLECMLAPGTYEARMTSLASVNDFDVIPLPGEDSIAGVTSYGLVELEMRAHMLPAWPWTTIFRLQGDWLGALEVRSWSISDEETFFVGLGAGRTSLVSARRTGESAGDWTAGATIPLSPAASPQCEIAIYDRDGDGLPEVALMNPTNLKIYSPWGASPSTPVETWSGFSGTVNTTIARVRHPQFTREWLAWVYTLTSNGLTQRFLTLGLEGARNLQLIGTGMGVFALTAGDIDGDGAEDILAGVTKDWSLNYVLNTGLHGAGSVGPVFVLADTLREVYSIQSAASNKATPLIVDIDNDADGDPGTPLQHEGRLWFTRQATYIHASHLPILVPYDAICAPDILGALVGTDILGKHWLTFSLMNPAQPPGTAQSGYWLDVGLWSRDGPAGELNSQSVWDERKPIPVQWVQSVFGFSVETSRWDPPPASAQFDDILYLVASIVEATDADSRPTTAYASLVLVLHGQDPDIDACAVRPVPGANEQFVLAATAGNVASRFGMGYNPNPGGAGIGYDIGLGGGLPDMPAEINNPPR